MTYKNKKVQRLDKKSGKCWSWTSHLELHLQDNTTEIQQNRCSNEQFCYEISSS